MPYPSQFSQPYQYPYQPQVPAPMDRLAQLQAQQYSTPTPMPAVNQPPQANQGILWVQGEAAARSYLVAPNTTVLLMDSEMNRFYLKSANNAGMPSMQIFEYSEVSQNAPQSTQSEQIDLDSKYVTRQEYDALQGKYMEILERLNNFPAADNSGDTAKRAEKASGSTRNKGGNANE